MEAVFYGMEGYDKRAKEKILGSNRRRHNRNNHDSAGSHSLPHAFPDNK